MPNISNKQTNQDGKQMYAIEVLETLSKMVYVKAYCLDEARDKVQQLYRDEEIVLYGDDNPSTDIGDYFFVVKDSDELECIGDDYYEVPNHD